MSKCGRDKGARCMERMEKKLSEKADSKSEIEKRRMHRGEKKFWFE